MSWYFHQKKIISGYSPEQLPSFKILNSAVEYIRSEKNFLGLFPHPNYPEITMWNMY